MRATAFFFLTLALLAFGSGALATTSQGHPHKQTAKDATVALPWANKNKPLTTSSVAATGANEPDGLVVIEDKAYVPSQPAKPAAEQWTMHSGELLSAVVARWCAKAGWQPPQWQADVDYSIKADASFKGDLITALSALMESYRHAKQPLHAAIYPPQRVVYVTPLTATDAE
jgi:hypothetical protein